MKTWKEVVKDFKKLEGAAVDIEGDGIYDFEDDLICLFGDYEYKGESYVMVTFSDNGGDIDFYCYINHEDAPVIHLVVESATGVVEEVSVN